MRDIAQALAGFEPRRQSGRAGGSGAGRQKRPVRRLIGTAARRACRTRAPAPPGGLRSAAPGGPLLRHPVQPRAAGVRRLAAVAAGPGLGAAGAFVSRLGAGCGAGLTAPSGFGGPPGAFCLLRLLRCGGRLLFRRLRRCAGRLLLLKLLRSAGRFLLGRLFLRFVRRRLGWRDRLLAWTGLLLLNRRAGPGRSDRLVNSPAASRRAEASVRLWARSALAQAEPRPYRRPLPAPRPGPSARRGARSLRPQACPCWPN